MLLLRLFFDRYIGRAIKISEASVRGVQGVACFDLFQIRLVNKIVVGKKTAQVRFENVTRVN